MENNGNFPFLLFLECNTMSKIRDLQIRKTNGEGDFFDTKMMHKSPSLPYLTSEKPVFSIIFCNFAPIQCVHDETIVFHISTNDSYS